MDLDELSKRILYRQHLEQQESNSAAVYDPNADMTESEVRNYNRFLFDQVQSMGKQMQALLDSMAEQQAESKRDRADRKRLLAQISELTNTIKTLQKEKEDLTNLLAVFTKEHFGSKSQKGISTKKAVKGKHDGRDDFDGPDESSQSSKDSGSENSANDEPPCEEKKDVYHGPSRKGDKYNKAVVGDPVEHLSDRSQLPPGAIILSSSFYKIRDIISQIIEHHFELVKVKFPDGTIKTVFLPHKDDKDATIYNEVVPGTHITANLLSYLLFNKYQMSTPAYRETKNRLADMDWNTCRQNIANWADKGAIQLNKLIPALKNIALQKGANVNVDETWERYQTHNGQRKTYMWCLVNRKSKIVIFFYEDTLDEKGVKHEGGRSRNVLTDFLGDAQINSLQSDAYNVYMYLDNELVDIEHLCCLAHARAKFKKALDQGCEKARFFLEKMGSLYRREEEYRRLELPPEEIRKRRNDAHTNKVVDELWNELFELLALPKEQMSDLMHKALNYLRNFWKQLFNYRNNGEYTIDNLAAERAIRPLTVQRKNSLFFGSTKGALNSATYNTFIETCKQYGISFRDYFQRVIAELKSGRTDYENLLPMTIGLK